jgi:hypothetical protein
VCLGHDAAPCNQQHLQVVHHPCLDEKVVHSTFTYLSQGACHRQ